MNIEPLHPHWPMLPGSYIEYEMYDFTGTVDDKLNITFDAIPQLRKNTYWTKGPRMRTTCVIDPGAQIPAVRRVNTEPGHKPKPTDVRGLYEGESHGDDLPSYIGEIGGAKCICIPPEPKLRHQPYIGDEFFVDCDVTIFPSVMGYSFPVVRAKLRCRYFTHAMDDEMIVTRLEERPGEPAGNWVYEYHFKKNVGLVKTIWGRRDGDKIVEGYILNAYKWGDEADDFAGGFFARIWAAIKDMF